MYAKYMVISYTKTCLDDTVRIIIYELAESDVIHVNMFSLFDLALHPSVTLTKLLSLNGATVRVA